jgi:hypothetical protein
MRRQVGVAVAAGMDRLQPFREALHVALLVGVLAGIRRVAHHGVEAGVLALEHLGELDVPMERGVFVLGRHQARPHGLARSQRVEPALPGVAVIALQRRLHSHPRRGLAEPGGAHGVADVAHVVQDGVGARQDRAEHGLALVVQRAADTLALDGGTPDAGPDQRQRELGGLHPRRPVQVGDAGARQADQRVAMA